jgi:hypothetical protein
VTETAIVTDSKSPNAKRMRRDPFKLWPSEIPARANAGT